MPERSNDTAAPRHQRVKEHSAVLGELDGRFEPLKNSKGLPISESPGQGCMQVAVGILLQLLSGTTNVDMKMCSQVAQPNRRLDTCPLYCVSTARITIRDVR